ncbi:hypothetical protein COMA2_80136 [Candidatus Nitrospira nitrificans]|uniref:Uncharacterized protein n=1 Tax=Candidatus Nitrospira nitrificans TaxID=1742973 RepID=A0A0S4LV32_9BACT|nr:hypothetical protein COMA2_80136 [Candidatus Nitrospira nitrificans]
MIHSALRRPHSLKEVSPGPGHSLHACEGRGEVNGCHAENLACHAAAIGIANPSMGAGSRYRMRDASENGSGALPERSANAIG